MYNSNTVVFAFVVGVTTGIAFLAFWQHCIKYSKDKSKKEAEVIDIDHYLNGENVPSWKKTHSN